MQAGHPPPKTHQHLSKARAIMAEADFRHLESGPPQARFLRNHDFSLPVIAEALDRPLSTVQRWCHSPETTTKRGRRGYLTASQDGELHDRVRQAAEAHVPVTISRLRELVSSDLVNILAVLTEHKFAMSRHAMS